MHLAFPMDPLHDGRTTVRVPMDSPYFAGHFPGAPVLPGVVQLGIVVQALGGSPLAEIVHFRLRQQVRPGDALELALVPRGREVGFDLQRAGERVAHGVLVPAVPIREPDAWPHAPAPAEREEASARPSCDVDLAELLPLTGDAMLLVGVEAEGARGAHATARVPVSSPFAHGGVVPAFACIELAAQAAGAHGSILQRAEGDFVMPLAGYLVVVRDTRLFRPSFASDEELAIVVTADGAAPPLALYAFSVRDASGVIAEGSLGTFVDRPQSERQQNH